MMPALKRPNPNCYFKLQPSGSKSLNSLNPLAHIKLFFYAFTFPQKAFALAQTVPFHPKGAWPIRNTSQEYTLSVAALTITPIWFFLIIFTLNLDLLQPQPAIFFLPIIILLFGPLLGLGWPDPAKFLVALASFSWASTMASLLAGIMGASAAAGFLIAFLSGQLTAQRTIRAIEVRQASEGDGSLMFGFGTTLFSLLAAASSNAGSGPFSPEDGQAVAACFGLLLVRQLRPGTWALALVAGWNQLPEWARTVTIPLPAVQKHLRAQLRMSWPTGIDAANNLLRYSAQFIQVSRVLNRELDQCPAECLIPQVAQLSDAIVEPKLLLYGTTSFSGFLLKDRVKKATFISRLQNTDQRQLVCYAFWLLHEKLPEKSAAVFNRLSQLPHANELEWLCRALGRALSAGTAQEIVAWEDGMLEHSRVKGEPIRRDALKTLSELRTVASEVREALTSKARGNRSTALGRATARLQRIHDAESILSEGQILRSIAKKWQPVLVTLGGEIGETIPREPVNNPFIGYSGLPVTGSSFIGRGDVMQRLQRLWTGDHEWPAVFLYGHRRMGKTSVLRNIEKTLRPGTLVVQMDMQADAFVDHTGQLFYSFADAIQRNALAAGLDAGPPCTPDDFDSPGKGRIALDAIFKRLTPQMRHRTLVIAIDEFEVVQDRINEGKVEPEFLTYLRSCNQRFRYLTIIFAGLHTLEEMGRDYQYAFFGSAEHIKVGYLTKDAAEKLLTQPPEDFSLEFSADLISELYMRTFGQPYLLQRYAWELVDAWNCRFLEFDEKLPRTLELKDLESLDSEHFFQATQYYFDGVWRHRSEQEQGLLLRLAEKGPLRDGELLTHGDQKLIDQLVRHDVVIRQSNGEIDFAAKLLRTWVHKHGRTWI